MFRAVVSLKLDQSSIRAKIDKALANSASVRRAAYKKAYGIFYNAKRTMIAEFDRHPITQEIDAGPRAVNISNTLDGYGNLFSFIGFHEGDRPTEPLRWLLENISMQQTVYRNRKWYFKVRIPNKEDIALVTPMPWEQGNSWALAVESYISGLSHYMYRRWGGGRSGMGIQLPEENWGEDITFVGTPYMSQILEHFRERVNNTSE